MDICAVVRGVSFYAPERRISVDTSSSELGTQAAKKVLTKVGLNPQDLDFIIAATLSPDFYFPGVGVQIQNQLKADFIPAIDIRGQNSGFAWGLATADAYIRSGLYRRILVVGTELFSRLFRKPENATHKKMLAYYGDGAGALVLEAQSCVEPPRFSKQMRGLMDHVLGADGQGVDVYAMKRPGCGRGHSAVMSEQDIDVDAYLPMLDEEAFRQSAIKHMVESAQTLLQRNHLSVEDLNLVITSSLDEQVNTSVCKSLDLPKTKLFSKTQSYGDTIAAVLPISLAEAEEHRQLKKGDLLLTLAFGAGLSWGANLIRW